MHSRTWAAMAVGATLGALAGIGVLAIGASLFVDQGVGAILLGPDSTARASFMVGQGPMHLLVLVAGAIGGSIIGIVGYAVSSAPETDARRFGVVPIGILGGVMGMVVAFASTRASLGISSSSIEGGIVTVSVFRAAVSALVAGATTGAVVALTGERLSRREVLGLEGEAWPSSPMQFMRDGMAAMGLPTLGLLLGLGIIYGLSQILLEANENAGLWLFGGLAAIVLFGAAAIAARPPDNRR